MGNEGVLQETTCGTWFFFSRGGSGPAVPVEKTVRCVSLAIPAFKTIEGPGNADDLWSRLKGSGNTVMNLGTRGSTAQI